MTEGQKMVWAAVFAQNFSTMTEEDRDRERRLSRDEEVADFWVWAEKLIEELRASPELSQK